MDTPSLFKGKEAQNDEALIRILGVDGPMTAWELSKQILRREMTKARVKGELQHATKPSYSEIRGKNSVLHRRIRHLRERGYLRKHDTKISKGNEVTVYFLTFKGFIAAVHLVGPRLISRLISETQHCLAPEGKTDPYVSSLRPLLDLWRRISRDDVLVRHLLMSPLRKAISIYNLESVIEVELLYHIYSILAEDVLASLASASDVRIRLPRMIERDMQLADDIVHAIDCYRTGLFREFINFNIRLAVVSAIISNRVSRCECEEKRRKERKELLTKLDALEKRSIRLTSIDMR